MNISFRGSGVLVEREAIVQPAKATLSQSSGSRRTFEAAYWTVGRKNGSSTSDMFASAAVRVIELTIVRTLMTGSLTETQVARLLFRCLQHA
jgi:hypothetical protein